MSKPQANVDIGEVVSLAAVNSDFFAKSFFAKTSRMESPAMHDRIWKMLDSNDRYVNIVMSRGWAKTTLLRLLCAKRVAYGVSRTILFVGASEKHTRRSIRWLRKQVEKNTLYAQTFGLYPGVPWTDEECEIRNSITGESVWVTGVGVTSSSGRGINFDDYRPDLIILDDVMNDENSRTKEGQEKIIDLVFGAFKESLAPKTEAPLAKLVMLNTPQDYGDISQLASNDPQFVSERFGCWTLETEDMPLEFRLSAWEERVPTATLQEEYRAAAARNRLSIFIRELECKLTTPETSVFREEWLQYYRDEDLPPLEEMWTLLVIDPVPPPSDQKLMKGIVDGDFEALSVLGAHKGKIYLLESVVSRGHNPTWTIAEFFRLVLRWRCRTTLVESVAYQATLSWLLREAMKKAGQYFVIEEFGKGDKRPKTQKITDGLIGVASNRQLYVKRDQHNFISQFTSFSLVRKIGKDDVIETVAVGCQKIQDGGFAWAGGGIGAGDNDDDLYEALPDYRGAP